MFNCFRPLPTSQGGGRVIGITNRPRAARSAVCVSVGQKAYPKRSDRLRGLFASLFTGHRPGHEFDFSQPWLGQGRLGFAYVSVKPEFGNQQFCLWAFGSGYKSKIVWLLRPVRYCGICG